MHSIHAYRYYSSVHQYTHFHDLTFLEEKLTLKMCNFDAASSLAKCSIRISVYTLIYQKKMSVSISDLACEDMMLEQARGKYPRAPHLDNYVRMSYLSLFFS